MITCRHSGYNCLLVAREMTKPMWAVVVVDPIVGGTFMCWTQDTFISAILNSGFQQW